MHTVKSLNLVNSFDQKYSETFTNNCAYEFGAHADVVNVVAFTKDGQYFVSGSDDSSIKLWSMDTKKLAYHFSNAHSGGVVSLAVSNDNRFLVSAGNERSIKFWDLDLKTLVTEIKELKYLCNHITISNDDKYVAGCTSFESIYLYDFHSKALIHEFKKKKDEGKEDDGDEEDLKCVRFTPDSKFILSCGNSKNIKLYSIETKSLVYTFVNAHSDEINSIAISNDGRYLVSVSKDRSVKVWDFIAREQIHHIKQAHSSEIRWVEISKDSQFFVTGSEGGDSKYWNLLECKVITDLLLSHFEAVNSIAFHPDGGFIVTGSKDCSVVLWGTDFGFALKDNRGAHSEKVNFVEVTPDSKRIISVSADRSIKIWDAESKDPLFHHLNCHLEEINSIAVTSDGKILASASKDKTIKLWNISDDLALSDTIEKAHTEEITSICFSADSSIIFSTSVDKSIKMWSSEDKKLLHHFKNAHEEEINSLSASKKKGDFFVSASTDKTIKIWNFETKQLLHTFQEAHNSKIHKVFITGDDKYIISSSEDSLKMWSVETRKFVHTFITVEESPILGFSVSSDQKFLIAGINEYSIYVWNLDSKKNLSILENVTQNEVSSISIAPNNEYFVMASKDLTFKTWNLNKNMQTSIIKNAHSDDDIHTIMMTLDGEYLVTCSSDKKIKIWDFATKKLVKEWKNSGKESFVNFAISDDSKYILAVCGEENVYLWSFDTSEIIHKFGKLHGENGIQTIDFTPDDKKFITSSGNGEIKMWDIETKKLAHDFGKVHNSTIYAISVSIDNKIFASASADESIKLWDIEKKSLVYDFQHAHKNSVNSIQITANKKNMISVSSDHDIKIWSIETFQLLHTINDAHSSAIRKIIVSRDCSYFGTYQYDDGIRLWSMYTYERIYSIPSFEDYFDTISISRNGKYFFSSEAKNVRIWSMPNLIIKSNDFSILYALEPKLDGDFLALPYGWNQYHYRILKNTKFDLYKACEDDAFCLLDFQGRLPIDYLNTQDRYKSFNTDSHKVFDIKLKCIERLQEINYLGYLKVMEDLGPFFVNILRNETLSNPKVVSKFLKLSFSPDIEDKETRQTTFGHDQISYGEPNDGFVECRYPVLNPEQQKELTAQQIDAKTAEIKTHKLKYARTALPLHLGLTSTNTQNLLRFLNLQSKRFFFEDEFMNMALDYLWDRSKIFQIFLFMLYSGFMIFVSVECAYSESPIEWIRIVVLIYGAVLLAYEVFQILLHGLDLYNTIDIFCYTLVVATMSLLLSDQDQEVIPYLKTLYVFAGYIRWIAYLRIADGMRSLIRTIMEIFKDMSYFLLILVFAIGAYTCVLESFNYGGEESSYLINLHKSYLFLYDSTLDPEPDVGLKAITVLFPLIINVVLLNMLISIMGDTYDKIQEKKTFADNQERVNMILEIVNSAHKIKTWWLSLSNMCRKQKKLITSDFNSYKMLSQRFDYRAEEPMDLEFPVPEGEKEGSIPFCLIRCETESEDVEDDWDGKLNFLLKRNVDAINESKIEIKNTINTIVEQKLNAYQESMKIMVETAIGDTIELRLKSLISEKLGSLENKINKLAFNNELPSKIDEFSEGEDNKTLHPIKININKALDKKN